MDFWIRAAQLVLSLSILIVLHEFGHFIPARLFKTRVEKFYLFFDPYFSLFKKKIGDTEWGIGWLPLGGYVKISGMVDESMDKEQMAQPAKPWEFRSKPAWQRLIIMLGGVFVNVVVGFLLFILIVWGWGEEKVDQQKMEYGMAVHPYMEKYGFRDGDIILTINGEKPTEKVEKLGVEIMLFDKKDFVVRHQDGKTQHIVLPEDIGYKIFENGVDLPFSMRRYFEGIDSVMTNTLASKMKLQKGDRFISVAGKEFDYFDEFSQVVYENQGKKTDFVVLRRGDTLQVSGVIPAKGDNAGKIGILSKTTGTSDTAEVNGVLYHQDYSFFGSFGPGFSKGWKTLYSNVAQLKYVFTSKGASSLGGFGTIGSLFPTSWDWKAFWSLTAFISIALAFMNILPIPALDGGHVIFLLYEIITGRPAPQRVMEVAQIVGFFILIGLILYANGNDIIRLFS